MPPPLPPSKNKYHQNDFKGPKTYEKDIQECKWRGISVPIINVQTEVQQNLVQHKYPDRNGAHIEATGRAPLIITAKAVFYNFTSRGKGETWSYGTLFPGTFKKFIDACADRTAGVLQHPILGALDVVCQRATYDLTGERRDGVIVDVSWIETIKNENEANKTTSSSTAPADAAALDDALNKLPAAFLKPLPTNRPLSFLDLIDKVKAFVDTATLAGQKLLAQIDHVLYHINNLLFSLRRINSVLVANIIQKAQALKASTHEIRQNVASSTAILTGSATYQVPADTTMGALVSLLGNPVSMLIKMNMKVAAKPIIPKGTIIRYAPGGRV